MRKREITSLRRSFDVRVETLNTLKRDVHLAAGNYVLATQRGELPAQFQKFRVDSGRTTHLKVHW